MKVRTLLMILMCATLNHTFSQNKKEQIDVLYAKLDSLNQLLSSERNISLNAISELNIKNVDLENQLNKVMLELQSCKKKVTEIENKSRVKSDSLNLLLSERPDFFIVKESLVIEGEEDVQEGVNEVFYECLSIPTNLALEKKINEIIFALHNFNSSGYACDPNEGFDSFMKSIPVDFKKINNRELNYFTSYRIFIEGNGHFSLVLNDEDFNLIWYHFMIEDGDVFFRFDRKFLDDPNREH